jgi:D-glycero-D-manno-heptose 1,7-bisphosphate phosphatase
VTELRTVFLDRDGVINRKRPGGDYVKSWEEFQFLPQVKEALRLLKEAGMRVVVVTNQRGIARRVMSVANLQEIHERMLTELAAAGASCDAIYFCPHDVGECTCRKPQTGMFLQVQKDFPDIDFSRSAMVGDSLTDIEAGASLGCRTFLIVDDPQIVDGTQAGSGAADGYIGSTRVSGVAPSLFEVVVRYLLPGVPV